MKYLFYIQKKQYNPISNLTLEKNRDSENFLIVRTSFSGTLTFWGDDFTNLYIYANQQIKGKIVEYNETTEDSTTYDVIYSFDDSINVEKKVINCTILYDDEYSNILNIYDKKYYANDIEAVPVKLQFDDNYYEFCYTAIEIIQKIISSVDENITFSGTIRLAEPFIISNKYLSIQNFKKLEDFTTQYLVNDIEDSELEDLQHKGYLFISLSDILNELRDIFGLLWYVENNIFNIKSKFEYDGNIDLSEFSNVENKDLNLTKKYKRAIFVTKDNNNYNNRPLNINFNYSNDEKLIISQLFDTSIRNKYEIDNSESDFFMIDGEDKNIILNELYYFNTDDTDEGIYPFMKARYGNNDNWEYPMIIPNNLETTNSYITWTTPISETSDYERLITRGFFGNKGEQFRIKFKTNINARLYLYNNIQSEDEDYIVEYLAFFAPEDVYEFDETITLTETGMFWLVFNRIEIDKLNFLYIEDFELISLNQKIVKKYNSIDNFAFDIKNILQNYNQHLLFDFGKDDFGNEYNFLIKNNITREIILKNNLLFDDYKPFFSYQINGINYRLEHFSRKIKKSTKQTEKIILSTSNIDDLIQDPDYYLLFDIRDFIIADFDEKYIQIL